MRVLSEQDMRRSEILFLLIVLASFVVAGVAYGHMPETMIGNWNVLGEADGQIPRFWGVFLMPLIGAVLLLMFVLIPRIDPLKKNIEKFRKYFDFFIVTVLLFFFYIYVLTLLWNVGWRFDLIVAMVPALAVLWYSCGVLIGKSERNWFIGIRTPWTLTDDRVWQEIHRLGGIMFKVSALIALAGMFFGSAAIFFVIVPPFCFMAFLMVYSYFVYRRIN